MDFGDGGGQFWPSIFVLWFAVVGSGGWVYGWRGYDS